MSRDLGAQAWLVKIRAKIDLKFYQVGEVNSKMLKRKPLKTLFTYNEPYLSLSINLLYNRYA